MILESVKLAIRTISRNIMRSVLTLLGIVIGVAAVIALVTIGQGTQAKVTADLSSLGTNIVIARPGSQQPGPPTGNEARSFAVRDVEALRNGLKNIRGLSPTSTKSTKAVYGVNSETTTVTGAEPDYFTVQDWGFSEGTSFTDNDTRAGTSVCVIGQTLKTDLFDGQSPIGKALRLGNFTCTVSGVLESKGQSAFGSDQDNTVVMPLRAFQRKLAGNTRIANIAVSASTQEDIAAVVDSMTAILHESRRIGDSGEDDFSVRDMSTLSAMLTSTTTVMTGLLAAVAAVSLVVGGIGIMNIMLVSVTERTREIGIRLAIGALANQVLTQFLVEAVVLCLLGGLLGITLGLSIAFIGSMALSVPFVIVPGIIALSFGFSGLIGLVFGYFPARRAASLDPIEALRHE
ncbi:ABC transporter permease [Aestuariivirga litoralis]|uniref:ABC transporter permease n=1 Tax=Aestuariivirga litoralis TaxID=2650924 RepID=UPI0018C56996|nr:ABC transporter permease [Aestuariivirga litoralis]MBG1233463.1 FtsX-like permease family protein [Aestuariivirga litoralis]